MEIITIQKYIHTSPRKLRLVADMVRKMNPDQAISVLQLTPKAAALDLQKAIKTVLASAKQQGADIQKVNFKKIEINESAKMRRFKAGTRGRVRPFKRRMCHIKIILTDQFSVVSSSVTDKLKTDKPETENRKQKTDNSKKGVK